MRSNISPLSLLPLLAFFVSNSARFWKCHNWLLNHFTILYHIMMWLSVKNLKEIKCHWLQYRSQNTVVSVVAKAMGMPKNCDLISGWKKKFPSSPMHPDWLWGPFSLLCNSYQGLSIPGGMEDRAQPTTHLQPVVRLRMSGVIPPLSIRLHGIQRKNFTFTFPCCNALQYPRWEDEWIYR